MLHITESLFDSNQDKAFLRVYDLDLESAEQHRRAANALARETRQAIDGMRLKSKPGYPLPEHVMGIDEAVERVRQKVVASSHLGDPCAPTTMPYAVVAVGNRGFVSVRHGAPYSMTLRGSKLWRFTDDDVEAIRKLLTDFGATITDDWRTHDEGHSFIIRITDQEA